MGFARYGQTDQIKFLTIQRSVCKCLFGSSVINFLIFTSGKPVSGAKARKTAVKKEKPAGAGLTRN